ncbi:MAG: GNAT family N-acetyltransferase [Magnetococcales bacterium]|nr:GNAT family N-acetyltransferase [Magnetococcales bacterium]
MKRDTVNQGVPLTKHHNRNLFDCGVTELDEYLKKFALQHSKKDISKPYVILTKDGPARICGYYTISTAHVMRDQLPENEQKGLSGHPVPVIRIGRLAVDRTMQGQGIGSDLLTDAMNKAMQIADMVGVRAVIVDAKDESAKAFYAGFGFVALKDTPLNLYMSLKTYRTAWT